MVIPNIGGYIERFGLTEWWLSDFTEFERDHIQQKFRPMGFPEGSRPLTQGNFRSAEDVSESLRPLMPTAMGTLSGLAGWFTDPDDAYLSLKIFEKAGSLGGSTLDWHFYYSHFGSVMWDVRYRLAGAEERSLWACDQLIAMSLEAKAAILQQWPGKPLPGHFGFRQRAAFHELAGERDEARALVHRAQDEGWTGFDDALETLDAIRRSAGARAARQRAKGLGLRTKACPTCKQRYVPGDQFCGECGRQLDSN